MSSVVPVTNSLRPPIPPASENWYAVKTRSRHERVVVHELESQGVTSFLPTVTEIRRWSDRRKKVELPLFPGYLFVHATMSPPVRRTVVCTHGVTSLITMNGEPIPIPDEQIETVQKLLANNIACRAYPFLQTGQRVRVRGGALDGVEGTFQTSNGDSLLVSINAIQRSLLVSIRGYNVEVL